MSSYPRYDVEAVKAAISVPDALERYGDLSKRRGNRCPCPIHGGKDNNLAFRDDSFHCFVCNCGGDVITLVEKIFNLSFPDAVKRLAEDFGIAPGVDPQAVKKRMAESQRRKSASKLEIDNFRYLSSFFHELQELPETPFRNSCINALSATLDDIIERNNAKEYPVAGIIETMRQGLKAECQMRQKQIERNS